MAHEYVIDLGMSVPSEFAADVEDRLAYAHRDIERIDVVVADRRHVRVTATAELDISWLQPVLATNAAEMLKASHEGTRIVLHDRRDARPAPTASAFPELVARGWVRPTSHGSFALLGPALRLRRALDAIFRTISLDMGAEEVELGSLMEMDTLRRAGHFNASPQHITLPSHLSEDLEYLKHVADVARQEDVDIEPTCAGHLETQGAVLAPAVCYNCYHLLRGQSIEGTRTFAAANTCYRYESGRMDSLARLWAFTMREAIFVGPPEGVKAQRADALARMWDLTERWNLHAWVENANDPFFIGEFDSRAAFQRGREMKYELRLSVAGDFAVAATSFNLHSATFGRSFDMRRADNGRPACSACCAWGEERWVLALFSQFGYDPASWPDELRPAVWGD
ncbi:MAG: hypothetical protein AB8G96_04395 [Phycisphaerales bacterium]